MHTQHQYAQELFNKISALSQDKLAVIEDFVDFIQHRGNNDALIKAIGRLSEPSFQKTWDNLEDADYDNLNL